MLRMLQLLIYLSVHWILCAASSGTFSSTINYQLHSINDLRQWPQFLLKGATRFKIDPHYVTSPLCRHNGEVHDPRGCLLLNHDLPVAQEPYNSTSDLLSLLSTIDTSLTIALCFKSAPDYCQNTTAFDNWVSLVDEFHAAASKFSHVEFLLDGDAKPANCLVGKWLPWNSVWIFHSSPDEALTSNSIENDYYRFQVLNDPESISDWTYMADINYGKFSNSSYPYQLWEPDAEADFHEYIDIYASGLPHAPGFHFAINIDIAMFWTYTGNQTHVALHSLLTHTSSISRNPFVIAIDGMYVVMYQQDDVICYTTVAEGDVDSITLAYASANIVAVSTLNDVMLIVFDDSSYTIYDVANNNGIITFTNSRSGSLAVTDILDGQLVQCLNHLSCNDIHMAVLSISNDSLLLSYWNIDDLTTPESSITIASNASAQHGRIAVTPSDVFIFYSSNNELFGAVLSDDMFWTHVGVGGNVGVSVAEDALMLVSDFGYCYNSHDHNTRSAPHVCSSNPKPLQHVLDYSIGLLSDWKDALMFGQPITSCHSRILHGSYDQGSHPSLALTVSQQGYSFVAAHEALRSDEKADGNCGTPMLRDGIVVDTFPIDEWVEALKR